MVQWVQFRSEEQDSWFLKMKSVDVVLHRRLFAEREHTGVMVDEPPPRPAAEGEDGDAATQQQLSASDPLCVYFPIDQTEMTLEGAKEIERMAMDALHDRLTDEQLHLENRLNTELKLLTKKVREFEMDQHQSMSKKQGDEHNEWVNKKHFLISVIQKRLRRFNATAKRRMFDLAKAVKNHPKLSPFLGATSATFEDVYKQIDETFPQWRM